jgi:hypothetical protein
MRSRKGKAPDGGSHCLATRAMVEFETPDAGGGARESERDKTAETVR